ncbi:hypothetical protein ACFOEX_02265 [Camelimonas abortus]|uniref:Uncharacterized protein n=1 Tax=Camelimonas abortus TaxID=1017184 RepID=A0ABV7LBB8_9HYPH
MASDQALDGGLRARLLRSGLLRERLLGRRLPRRGLRRDGLLRPRSGRRARAGAHQAVDARQARLAARVGRPWRLRPVLVGTRLGAGGFGHVGLGGAQAMAADDARLDDHVGRAADHDQVLHMVAPHQHKLALVVEVIDVHDSKPRLARARPCRGGPLPAGRDAPQDESKDHHHDEDDDEGNQELRGAAHFLSGHRLIGLC